MAWRDDVGQEIQKEIFPSASELSSAKRGGVFRVPWRGELALHQLRKKELDRKRLRRADERLVLTRSLYRTLRLTSLVYPLPSDAVAHQILDLLGESRKPKAQGRFFSLLVPN